jgi:selenocysteine lyase/cysteine desulfurase
MKTSFNDTENMDTACAEFLEIYPVFNTTQQLDALRDREYQRLDAQQHIYLDYTGGGLYAESQLEEHMALLKENVFGNPHSSNPTSLAMTELVEQARHYVLEYFNASPDEYVVIFTSNASGGLKLVGESYPFGSEDHYLLTFDNHNSVNGIREFARKRGAHTTYIPLELPDMRVDDTKLADYLALARPGGNNLFAYPAQSNFSGVQHPLAWIEQAQAMGWDVLVDAAAFVPTNKLDLRRWKPNFVPISFYKMFGYPTGVGCLLARKDSLKKLHRPWFAGGTITVASVQGDKYYMAEDEAAFEDGTLNYLTLPAVEIGLRHLTAIGVQTIHERVCSLTGWLLNNLLMLQHSNGQPVIRFYGPLSANRRGGTIAMNFYDAGGQFFDHRQIEAEANKVNISLRTGCFCNPGGGEIALGLSQTELVGCFTQPQERLTVDDFRLCIDGKSSGAVRISVGLVTNFADVYRFIQFAKSFIDKTAV